MSHTRAITVFSLALGALNTGVLAQDTTWAAAVSGNWNAAANWTGNIPDSLITGNSAAINLAGAYTVTLDRNSATPGGGTAVRCFDMTLDAPNALLLVTAFNGNPAELTYNAQAVASVGIRNLRGTLRLLNGSIVQGIAGNRGILNRAQMFGEATSSFGADVTNDPTGQFHIVGRTSLFDTFVTAPNIANNGLVALESAPALNGADAADATLTMSNGGTLTNNNGATFAFTGGGGRRFFNGNLLNDVGGTVNIGVFNTTFGLTPTNTPVTWTNRGSFNLTGTTSSLNLRGTDTVRPIFIQENGTLNARGNNTASPAGANFFMDKGRFIYSGGTITNGPIVLTRSQLQTSGGNPGAMFVMTTAPGGLATEVQNSEILGSELSQGQTVASIVPAAGAKLVIARDGSYRNNGTMIFDSAAGDPGAATSRLQFIATNGNNQARAVFTNSNILTFGAGGAGATFMKGADVVNQFRTNVNADVTVFTGSVTNAAANGVPRTNCVFNVASPATFEVTSSTFSNRNGICTGDGHIRTFPNFKVSNVQAGTIKPGRVLGTTRFTPEPIGALTVEGDFEQHDTADIDIFIAGTAPQDDYAQLLITGNASLSGLLHLTLSDTFQPLPGMSFDVLAAGHIDIPAGEPPIELDNAPVVNGYTFVLDPVISSPGSPDILRVEVVPVPTPGVAIVMCLGLAASRRRRSV